MQGFEIKFNIYADSQQEVEDARNAIVGFINQHAQQGRAVSAKKVAEAVRNWEKNPIVRNAVINFFK